MPLSYEPARRYMTDHGVSFFDLAEAGVEPRILKRLRQDKPLTTDALETLCRILKCQPGDLLEYTDE